MYILGINAFHAGASACLIRDGEIVAAIEEERLSRIKYCAGFPHKSIRFCLETAGISPEMLDHIAISRDPNANLHRKVLFALSKRPRIELLKSRLENVGKIRNIDQELRDTFPKFADQIRAKIHRVEHHRSHISSAFFVSPFDRAALLSIDGFGDFVSTMWSVGKKNDFKVIDSILFPHSIGIFYTAISQFLGFQNYGDEGKVMGLVAYGKPKFLDYFRKMIFLKPNGKFELNLDFFRHHSEGVEMNWDYGKPTIGTLYSEKLIDRFGMPRKPLGEITERDQDLAASLQAMLEETVFHLLGHVHRETGETNLCLAGGVALNSSMNGKIRQNTPFRELFIQPAASDAGTSIGAAFHVYHKVLNRDRVLVMNSASIGPEFSDAEIKTELDRQKLNYRSFDDFDQLTAETAKLIADQKVVGWFQGRMEFGPRALGNRSIVADPRSHNMKKILNDRVKNREAFRPFAPSILSEAIADYFEEISESPFMLEVRKIKKNKIGLIPAVTHFDHTARLQTVNSETQPKFWKLIRSFEKLTSIPIILNTSFNENEPIVHSPKDAVNCFLRTKMNALAIGKFLIEKQISESKA